MARLWKIAWKHPAEGFYQLYKQEVEVRIAKRWQALWMLQRGEQLKRVKEVGGSAASRFSRCSGRGMGPCGFSQGKGSGRGVAAVGSRGEGLTAGKVALYPSRFECPAFMIKKLCL
jgi:hypothetical protein